MPTATTTTEDSHSKLAENHPHDFTMKLKRRISGHRSRIVSEPRFDRWPMDVGAATTGGFVGCRIISPRLFLVAAAVSFCTQAGGTQMTVTDAAPVQASPAGPTMLGPFLGFVTERSIKIWLHLQGGPAEVFVSVHRESEPPPTEPSGLLKFAAERLWTDWTTIGGLQPGTEYVYGLWLNAACSVPLPLQGLRLSELRFKTIPEEADAQLDFLMMSCHNPAVALQDGFEGHGVWADIPQIIAQDSNKNVRFALLVGDQVYADDWKKKLLEAPDHATRLKLYLEVYRKYWSHIHYRRVLCALPAMMMWDDHDIMDGWGSTADSFETKTSSTILPNYLDTFKAASETFGIMQASRNPVPLSEDPADGYDCCFRIGKWGFVLLDLRTNRNLRLGRLMTNDQAYRIRNWVTQHKVELNGLFIVSPVVFTHAAPSIDAFAVSIWPTVMKAVDWLAQKYSWGKSLQRSFKETLDDIRDDVGERANGLLY